MSKGVNLVGYIRAEFGLGESCRLCAGSLEAAQIPFDIKNYPVCSSRQEDRSWIHKEVLTPNYNTNILHINSDNMALAYKVIGKHFFENKYNIGVWHWELPEFPESMCDGFQFVDEVWAPSRFIYDAIKEKATIPVRYMPHGIVMSKVPPISRKHFSLPEKAFLFLTMYDPCSYTSRKNPEGAIQVFKKAFKGNDLTVGLVVKVNSLYGTEENERLKELIGDYKNIYVINTTLDRQKMSGLMKSINCFLSLHRSEGFGLSITEAMISEKPVIATNWSGNTDFMNNKNSCPVNYTLKNVAEDYGPYKTNQQWAEPDLTHAEYYMKRVVYEPTYRSKLAENARVSILNDFSPNNAGDNYKKRLEELKRV